MIPWFRIVVACTVLRCTAGPVAPTFEELASSADAQVEQNPGLAASLYRQALSLRPKWVEGWFYLGATLLRVGQADDAREALLKATDLEPGKGTSWAYLGVAEYELHHYEAALSNILRGESIGLADQPEFIAAVHYRAALCELRFGIFDQAMEQLRPLITSGNDSPALINALGISALQLHVLPELIPAAKSELVSAAGSAAWAFLAEQPEVAKPRFESLIQRFPREPGVQYMYGTFLMKDDPAAAEAAFRKEMLISPSDVWARVQLATLLLRRGDAMEAVSVSEAAVELAPKDALCHATLGRSLMATGDAKQASAVLERAVKLAPTVARAHLYLMQAYLRCGRSADAQKEKAEFNRLQALQNPTLLEPPANANGLSPAADQ